MFVSLYGSSVVAVLKKDVSYHKNVTKLLNECRCKTSNYKNNWCLESFFFCLYHLNLKLAMLGANYKVVLPN